MGTVFAVMAGAVSLAFGVLINAIIENWRTSTQRHLEKIDNEFKLQRAKIEQLHPLLDSFCGVYENHIREWDNYCDRRSLNIDGNISTRSPPLPRPPSGEIFLIIDLYLPEARSDFGELIKLSHKYLDTLTTCYNKKTLEPELHKCVGDMHRQAMTIRKLLSTVHRERLERYLEKPAGSEMLGSTTNKLVWMSDYIKNKLKNRNAV